MCFSLTPTSFAPRASDAAPSPKHRDVLCQGVRVAVTDANASRPYELGIRLLHSLRTQKGFRWTREGALDWLVGTRRLRLALERGDTPEAILASDAPELAAWERERAPFLLYQ